MSDNFDEIYKIVCNGFSYEIGPDRDGVGMVELKYFEVGNVRASITMDPKVARKIAYKILDCASELEWQK